MSNLLPLSLSPSSIPTTEILGILAPAFRLLLYYQENHVFSASLYKLNQEIKRHKKADLLNNQDDLKERLLIKYYNFLNIFLKLDLDTLPPYYSYDYQIVLNKPKELLYRLLYLQSIEELKAIKQYLVKNLNKGFIISS